MGRPVRYRLSARLTDSILSIGKRYIARVSSHGRSLADDRTGWGFSLAVLGLTFRQERGRPGSITVEGVVWAGWLTLARVAEEGGG